MNGEINIYSDSNFTISELERNKENIVSEIHLYYSDSTKLNIIYENELSRFIHIMDYFDIIEEETFQNSLPAKQKFEYIETNQEDLSELELLLVNKFKAKRIK